MPMDLDDQRFFAREFGLVHKRITESEKTQTGELHRVTNDQNEKLSKLKESIETHKVESSQHNGAAISAAAAAAEAAVKAHNDESWVHNPVKTSSLVATLAAIFTALGAGIMWVIKHFTK